MSQPAGGYQNGDLVVHHQGGTSMTQVVEPEVRKPSCFKNSIEVFAHVALMEWISDSRGQNQVVVVPPVACDSYFCGNSWPLFSRLPKTGKPK